MDTKTCGRFGELKPLDQFYRFKGHKSGRQSYCRPCSRKAHRAWQSRPDVKAHLAEYMRGYRRRVKMAKQEIAARSERNHAAER